jgi:hypothetical protein
MKTLPQLHAIVQETFRDGYIRPRENVELIREKNKEARLALEDMATKTYQGTPITFKDSDGKETTAYIGEAQMINKRGDVRYLVKTSNKKMIGSISWDKRADNIHIALPLSQILRKRNSNLTDESYATCKKLLHYLN